MQSLPSAIAASTNKGPRVFIFENPHWADQALLDLLFHVKREMKNLLGE
jgi:predicted ATPase